MAIIILPQYVVIDRPEGFPEVQKNIIAFCQYLMHHKWTRLDNQAHLMQTYALG